MKQLTHFKIHFLATVIASQFVVAEPLMAADGQSTTKPMFQLSGSRNKKATDTEQTQDSSGQAQSINALPTETLRLSPSTPGSTSSHQVTLKDRDMSVSLSQAEMALINEKRDALIKYLFGEEQLVDVRSYISEKEREKKLKEMHEREFPLSPDEITQMRMFKQNIVKAENSPLTSNVEIKLRTIDFDISNSAPIDLYVAQGYASSIVIFDQTGQPWPISGDVIGDSTAFSSKKVDGAGNIIVFELLKEFSESNALLGLQGENTTLVIRLISNGETVDSRLSIRIPRAGPNARESRFVNKELENASPDTMLIMDGDLPIGAQRLSLSGVDGEAVFLNGELYVRSRHMLISPPWKETVTSVSGNNVYKIPQVTQLIFAVDGALKNATIRKQFQVPINKEPSLFEGLSQ